MTKTSSTIQYPAAVISMNACYENYKDFIEQYHKIYDRAGVLLALCGAVLPYMVGFSAEQVKRALSNSSHLLNLADALSILSILVMIGAIIGITKKVLCGNQLTMFDARTIRNKRIYNLSEDEAALWMLKKYTDAINILCRTIQVKQRAFDWGAIVIIMSILLYAIANVLAGMV